MDWFTGNNADRHHFLLAVIVYGVSMMYSVFLWRKHFRQDDRVNYLLLLCAFVPHTLALVQRGLSLNRCPVHNLFEATMFFTWATTLAFLLVGLKPRLRFIGAFASPVLFAIGVFALMPSLDPPYGNERIFTGGMQSLHAATILLAYGAFGLCAAAGAMYLTQQHNLKHNKRSAVLSLLPSIERLDKITTHLALVGFVLLTVGLFAGAQLPRKDGVAYWKDMKVVWSAVLWLMYAGLLSGRRFTAITGRRFAIGLVSVFVFLVLTFWGTNLLSTLHRP